MNHNTTKTDEEFLGELTLPFSSIANLHLPDPDLRSHYIDENKRIFRLDVEISDYCIKLIDFIIKCNTEDKGKPIEERTPIKVLISSPGGDMAVGWAIIQAILTSKTPVWTINYCYAYSMAAEILVAGHKRFALKGTSCLIHKGSTSISGEHDIVESARKFFKSLEKKMTNFLFSRTKITSASYNKKASSDMYYDENEMLSAGIIDKIIEDYDEVF